MLQEHRLHQQILLVFCPLRTTVSCGLLFRQNKLFLRHHPGLQGTEIIFCHIIEKQLIVWAQKRATSLQRCWQQFQFAWDSLPFSPCTAVSDEMGWWLIRPLTAPSVFTSHLGYWTHNSSKHLFNLIAPTRIGDRPTTITISRAPLCQPLEQFCAI